MDALLTPSVRGVGLRPVGTRNKPDDLNRSPAMRDILIQDEELVARHSVHCIDLHECTSTDRTRRGAARPGHVGERGRGEVHSLNLEIRRYLQIVVLNCSGWGDGSWNGIHRVAGSRRSQSGKKAEQSR